MTGLSRRALLGACAGTAALGLAGCGGDTEISADPAELVMWYWARSVHPGLLAAAAENIPGTDARLRSDVVGGNFDVKLRTSLAGQSYIPDLTMINSNVALYFPNEEQFLDLGEMGASEYESSFLDWMWQNGVTTTGAFRFWPTNTGPTAFFYRTDLLEQAGLDPDPDAVAETVADWDSYLELGRQVRTDLDIALAANATNVFNAVLNCSDNRYLDPENQRLYTRDGSAVRQAWEVAVTAAQDGLTARTQTETEINSAFASGNVIGNITANWWGPILKDLGPETAGRWRVTQQPERPGNSGGSFLCIPRTCKDPEAAMAFIVWLLNPENQQATFGETELFPASLAALDLGQGAPDDFFGGQNTYTLFKESAEGVPVSFFSPYEFLVSEAVATELTNVETAGKDPDVAWADALALSDRQLQKKGLL